MTDLETTPSPSTTDPPGRSLGLRQSGAWAGMIGPLLFVAVFTIEGWLRPGYTAASMFISELSRGPRGFIQILNFVVLGALLVWFSRGVAAEFQARRASLGAALLGFIGLSFLLSGLFVMDPATTPVDQMSSHGKLHYLFGMFVFTLGPISCFWFFRRFRTDPSWQPLAWWTLAAGTVMAAAVVLMSVAPTHAPAPPNAYNQWVGVIQRTAIFSYLAWVFTFGLALRQRSR